MSERAVTVMATFPSTGVVVVRQPAPTVIVRPWTAVPPSDTGSPFTAVETSVEPSGYVVVSVQTTSSPEAAWLRACSVTFPRASVEEAGSPLS